MRKIKYVWEYLIRWKQTEVEGRICDDVTLARSIERAGSVSESETDKKILVIIADNIRVNFTRPLFICIEQC